MEDKIKFIIIGLAGILVISFLVNLQTFNSKRTAERERDELRNENDTLMKKIDEAVKEKKQLQDKINLIALDLDKISKERENIEKQSEGIRKRNEALLEERDKLAEKFKAKRTEEEKETKEEAKAVSTVTTEDKYWAGVLKTKTGLESQLESARGELKSTQIEKEELQKDKSISDLDLKGLMREKEDLEHQLEYSRKTLDNISAALVQEKNMNRNLQDSLKLIKNENLALRRQLKILADRKVDLEKKVVELREQNLAFERKFNELGVVLEEKYSQLGELKQKIGAANSGSSQVKTEIRQSKNDSIELPPIVVYPQDSSMPKEKSAYDILEGRVLAVNKDNNFVIIDLGENSGLKIGDTFKVYREEEQIAALEVIEVRKDITACDIKQETAPIQVGDAVK